VPATSDPQPQEKNDLAAPPSSSAYILSAGKPDFVTLFFKIFSFFFYGGSHQTCRFLKKDEKNE